ncbi:hypothetical protein C8R45DRAFT_1094714 [Mycena sanguinolenta]|nr:hypothetical protein C8R45DRAFT_1094714 [Mycena sanguinolenta]
MIFTPATTINYAAPYRPYKTSSPASLNRPPLCTAADPTPSSALFAPIVLTSAPESKLNAMLLRRPFRTGPPTRRLVRPPDDYITAAEYEQHLKSHPSRVRLSCGAIYSGSLYFTKILPTSFAQLPPLLTHGASNSSQRIVISGSKRHRIEDGAKARSNVATKQLRSRIAAPDESPASESTRHPPKTASSRCLHRSPLSPRIGLFTPIRLLLLTNLHVHQSEFNRTSSKFLRLSSKNSKQLLKAEVITWRGILKKIMLGDDVDLNVSYHDGVLYAEEQGPLSTRVASNYDLSQMYDNFFSGTLRKSAQQEFKHPGSVKKGIKKLNATRTQRRVRQIRYKQAKILGYRKPVIRAIKCLEAHSDDEIIHKKPQERVLNAPPAPASEMSKILPRDVPIDYFDPPFFNTKVTVREGACYMSTGVACPLSNSVKPTDNWLRLPAKEFMPKYGEDVLPSQAQMDALSDSDPDDELDDDSEIGSDLEDTEDQEMDQNTGTGHDTGGDNAEGDSPMQG